MRIRVKVGLGPELGGNGASGDGQVVMLDEFNEPGLKVPQIGDRVAVSFPMDGPLVIDAKAAVESVEALIAEA